MRSRLALVVCVAALGCHSVGPPPSPAGLHRVAVFPPVNRTGQDLLVTGGSLLERYAFATPRTDVPGVLGIALRAELTRRGIAVVPAAIVEAAAGSQTVATADAAAALMRRGHVTEPLLFVAVDRWEPDAPTEPTFVIVALDATLVEPETGAVRWHWHRRAAPVRTAGAVTRASAYEIAVDAVAAELLRSWGTAP